MIRCARNNWEYSGTSVTSLVLQSPLVAIDQRFVRSASDGATRVRLNDQSSTSASLTFKDVASRKSLFLTEPMPELQTLLDAAGKQPIVTVARKDNIRDIYYAYRPESAPDTSGSTGGFVTDASDKSELLQIYVKLGDMTKTGYLPTNLRVDLTDLTTGERCKIEMEGEWHARSAVLWLERSSTGGSSRVPISRSFRPMGALRSDFFVDIAPNVNTALVMLVFALVDDVLKQERRLARLMNCDGMGSALSVGISVTCGEGS